KAQRYSPPAAITARRAPARSDSATIGRAGPRRARRAASAIVVELSGTSSTRDVAGGSESHATPASAPVSGEGPEGGGCTYQSPSRRRVPGQRSTAPLGLKRLNDVGSPASMTSAAPATARATSLGGRPSSVVPSRQRFPPGSASMNVRTGTRATSSSVRARNRVSQSGGEASSTMDGGGLTSSTNRRASSRGSSSPTPSNRTST